MLCQSGFWRYNRRGHTTMTPEQIRVVIAEELGWKVKNCISPNNWAIFSPEDTAQGASESNTALSLKDFLYYLPAWPYDLNACHEMEKVLSMCELVEYGNHLNRMKLSYNYGYVEQVINATSHQRCEAWIKTRCPEKRINQ